MCQARLCPGRRVDLVRRRALQTCRGGSQAGRSGELSGLSGERTPGEEDRWTSDSKWLRPVGQKALPCGPKLERGNLLRIEVVASSERHLLQEWDALVKRSKRGSYCQLSSWLASLAAYGFGFEVLVMIDGGRVVGGIPYYRYSVGQFRLVSSPLGPLIEDGYESHANSLIDAYLDHASDLRAMFVQMQVAASLGKGGEWLLGAEDVRLRSPWVEGILFRTGNVPNQLLLVSLEPLRLDPSGESLLKSFKSRTRRDVRASLRSPLTIELALDESAIRAGYEQIERNGDAMGYATRSWGDMRDQLVQQVLSGSAAVHVARMDGEAVGAHYGLIAGQKLTYMMGGTQRLHPDPNVGHFLHWHVMQYAAVNGIYQYDLTTYGNEGTRRFKEGFMPEITPFVEPRHVVMNRPATALFLRGYRTLRQNKATAARVARRIRPLVAR